MERIILMGEVMYENEELLNKEAETYLADRPLAVRLPRERWERLLSLRDSISEVADEAQRDYLLAKEAEEDEIARGGDLAAVLCYRTAEAADRVDTLDSYYYLLSAAILQIRVVES